MPDIVAIGEPLFELNQGRGEDVFRPGHGGDTSNCAIAAARQGASVGYVTAIGADQFGESFIKLWADEGIDTSAVKTERDRAYRALFRHARSGRACLLLHARGLGGEPDDGGRYSRRDDPRPGCCMPRASARRSPRARRIAVFAAMRIARARRRARLLRHQPPPPPVAARSRAGGDPCRRRPQPTSSGPASTTPCHLTGLADPDRIVDFYLGLGPKIVALTLGSDGALIATEDRRERLAPYPAKLVDATGAGDTFDGAFLAEYLRTGDPFAAGHYANVAAALSTEGYGAVAPMPRRPAVEAALKRLVMSP